MQTQREDAGVAEEDTGWLAREAKGVQGGVTEEARRQTQNIRSTHPRDKSDATEEASSEH